MEIVLAGGAGGIGQRLCSQLLESGHEIRCLDRDSTGLDALPEPVETHTVDLADETQVESALADANPDAFISVVGWYAIGALEDCSPEVFRDHLESNLVAVHVPVQALLSRLRRRSGRIVLVGSMVGSVSLPFHGAYSAAKAGLAGYANSLRRELAPQDVSVTLVEPGPVRTGFNERAASHISETDNSAYTSQYRDFEGYSPSATTPETVVETVLRVLESERPKARYRLSHRARWLPRLQAVLPAWLFDRLVRAGLPGGLLGRLIDR